MNSVVQSFYAWYRNQVKHPKYRWVVILGTLLYLIIPFDLCPDFLPIVGLIDDGVVLAILGTELSRLILDYRNHRKDDRSPSMAEEGVVDVTGRVQ